jgi:hypothetical protein
MPIEINKMALITFSRMSPVVSSLKFLVAKRPERKAGYRYRPIATIDNSSLDTYRSWSQQYSTRKLQTTNTESLLKKRALGGESTSISRMFVEDNGDDNVRTKSWQHDMGTFQLSMILPMMLWPTIAFQAWTFLWKKLCRTNQHWNLPICSKEPALQLQNIVTGLYYPMIPVRCKCAQAAPWLGLAAVLVFFLTVFFLTGVFFAVTGRLRLHVSLLHLFDHGCLHYDASLFSLLYWRFVHILTNTNLGKIQCSDTTMLSNTRLYQMLSKVFV